MSKRVSAPLPRPPLPKQAVLFVNAKSRRGRRFYRQASRSLEAAGIELIERVALRKPDELPERVAAAVKAGAPMIIVGGGDGSLSSAVDGLVGSDTVFALLPLGTANSFARALGIPLELEGAIDVIATGERRRIDLGVIDGDYYANNATIGLATQIAETIPPGLKRTLGRVGYAMWALLRLARFRPFTLSVDGERLVVTEVRISNGGYHGGMELIESAGVQSGDIVVQAVMGNGRRHLAWNYVANMLGLRARHATVREFHGTDLRIECDPPQSISIDGEVLTRTPVMAGVARGVIEVAAPRAEVSPPRAGA